MKLIAGILIFLVVNLLITLWLRYQNGNDGWLEYYRSKGGKVVDKGP